MGSMVQEGTGWMPGHHIITQITTPATSSSLAAIVAGAGVKHSIRVMKKL